MWLYSITGKLVFKNLNKYRVKWDKPCRSKVQFAVKQFLRDYWSQGICYEEMPVVGSRMSVDFVYATKKIAVETDGQFHEEYNPHFHKGSPINFLASIKRDEKKRAWLEKNGFKLVRIMENEVKDLTPEFFEKKFGIKLV